MENESHTHEREIERIFFVIEWLTQSRDSRSGVSTALGYNATALGYNAIVHVWFVSWEFF